MRKYVVTPVVFGFVLAMHAGSAHADSTCGKASRVGDICTCRVLELHPTQLAVGMIEVKEKEADLASKKASKQAKYLQKHPEPVVQGPGSVLFIIDHHHLARAAADQNIETTYCEVKADYSELDASPFWAKMEKQHWVYLYDENGKGPHDPADLPRSVEGLKDDPYRSLAGAVREGGGFAKVKIPFAEFKWADFFRDRISASEINNDFKMAVRKALAMAGKRDACSLPGYNGQPC